MGKTVNVTLGALLSGQPLKQSIQTGMSLAQIGGVLLYHCHAGIEFTGYKRLFIPDSGRGIGDHYFYNTVYDQGWPIRSLPGWRPGCLCRWRTAINQYSTGAQTIQAESDWRIVLRSYMIVMATNSVIVIAIILLSVTYLLPLLEAGIPGKTLPAIITFTLTLAATAPFFWGLAIRRLHSLAYRNLWLDKKYNHGPLVMLEVVRNILLVVLVGFLVNQLFNTLIALVAILPLIIVCVVCFCTTR